MLAGLLGAGRAVPGEQRENDVLVDQVQLWTSRRGGAAPATDGSSVHACTSTPEEAAPRDPTPTRARTSASSRSAMTPSLSTLQAVGRRQPAQPPWTQLPELRAVLSAELTRASEVFRL